MICMIIHSPRYERNNAYTYNTVYPSSIWKSCILHFMTSIKPISRLPFQNAKEKPRSCRLNGKCHPVIARLYSNSGLYINSRKKIIGIDSMTVIPNGDTQGLNHGISRRASMALHVVNMTVWMLLCKIKHERRSGDYGRSAGGTTNAPTQIPNKRWALSIIREKKKSCLPWVDWNSGKLT